MKAAIVLSLFLAGCSMKETPVIVDPLTRYPACLVVGRTIMKAFPAPYDLKTAELRKDLVGEWVASIYASVNDKEFQKINYPIRFHFDGNRLILQLRGEEPGLMRLAANVPGVASAFMVIPVVVDTPAAFRSSVCWP